MIMQRTPTTTTKPADGAGAASAAESVVPGGPDTREFISTITEFLDEIVCHDVEDETNDANIADSTDASAILNDLFEVCCTAGDDMPQTQICSTSKDNFSNLEQTVLARSLARSHELMRNCRKRAAPARDAPAAKRTKQAVVAKAKTSADIVYRPSFAPQNITDREAIFRAGIDKVDQARKQRVEHWLAVRKTRIDVRNCFTPVCEAKKLVAMSKARARGRFKKQAAWPRTLSASI